jgi:predicted ATPase
MGYALSYAFNIHELCGDVQSALGDAEAYLALATEQAFSMFLAEATIYRGWALAETGRVTEGIKQIREGIIAWVKTGGRHFLPYYRALMADAYARGDRSRTERLRQLDKAIFLSKRNHEPWFEAELYRRRGELMASSIEADPAAAEADFRRSIAIARNQSARWWELRAATSLGYLLRSRGKCAEAYDLVAPIYDWFTEGRDTPVLLDARALLESIH